MGPAQTFTSLQNSLVTASTQVMTTVIGFIPHLLAAVIIFLIGTYLSKLAKSLLTSLLKAINLSVLIKNSSIERFLERAEVRLKVEEILGEALRWLILYIFIITAVNVIGLTTVGDFLMGILGYLPRVIAASFILAVGVIIAGFTESVVKSSIAGFDASTARMVGKVASYTVVIFAILVAIGELGIAESFINTLFMGFVAMLAIGLGLAFGLGAKDLIARILDQWYQDFHKTSKKK